MLADALDYYGRGWTVLPLRGKKPHDAALEKTHGKSQWRTLRKRPPTERDLLSWFSNGSKAGVGIICGQVSNGLVVVDFDNSDDFPPEGFQLPLTASVQTARGEHLYYRADIPIGTKRFPWGEIRGDGSYVVAPSSRHESGWVYGWRVHPDELPLAPFSSVSIPGFAQAVYQAVQEKGLHPSRTDVEGIRRLEDYDRDASAVKCMAAVLGIPPVRLGSPFSCVLHGPDKAPSANLWRTRETGQYLYHDWHAEGHADEWVTLAEVRARLAGRSGSLTGPELAVWKRRLLVEAGLLAPAPVKLPKLPTSAPKDAARVYKGFRLLLECSWTGLYGVPCAFSRRFASAWCALLESQARAGLEWLESRGYLLPVGQASVVTYGRPTKLWLPGGADV